MYSGISGEQNDQFVREMKLPNGRERVIPDGEQKIQSADGRRDRSLSPASFKSCRKDSVP